MKAKKKRQDWNRKQADAGLHSEIERQISSVLRPETEQQRLWKKLGKIDLRQAFKRTT